MNEIKTKKKKQGVLLFNIILGLLFIDLIFITFTFFNYFQFEKKFYLDKKVYKIHLTSFKLTNHLKYKVVRAESLMKNWVFIDRDTAAASKKELIKILDVELPQLRQQLKFYAREWSKEEQVIFYKLSFTLDSIIDEDYAIMKELTQYSDYNNPVVMFFILPRIRENGEIVELNKRLVKQIDLLLNIQEQHFKEFLEQSSQMFENFKVYTVYISIFFIIITVIILLILRRRLLKLQKITDIIETMSLGVLPEIKLETSKDEIGRMSAALKRLVEGLKKISDFALQIGANKFDTEFTPLSKDDVLGNALLKMRDNLIKAQKEAELRRIENAQRSWISQGIAEINEIIRNAGNDMDKLIREVIAHIVNYTNSVLGGIYIYNDENEEEPYLELKAFYAYDREKYIKQKIKIGETLVGQCFYEGQSIYMNDVPQDYIKIVSGLGSDKPKAILLTPLIVNEEKYGVIELASFEEYPKYKIEFVEKIGETIAAAIATLKININTQKLLKERQIQTEKLIEQEVKAREAVAKIEAKLKEIETLLMQEKEKNKELEQKKKQLIQEIEKLKTQYENELKNKQKALETLFFALNKSIAYYELSINGDYLTANNKYAQLLNVKVEEIIGNKHSKFLSRDFINLGNYKKIWDRIKKGETVYTTIQYIVEGKNKFINENFVPIMDKEGKLEKVIVFSQI